jgi:hypothetical protein
MRSSGKNRITARSEPVPFPIKDNVLLNRQDAKNAKKVQ